MTPPGGATVDLHDQVIRQNCRTLKTPAIAAQYQGLAERRPAKATAMSATSTPCSAPRSTSVSARRCCGGSRRPGCHG